VLLDTVGIVALLNKDDGYHAEATEVFRAIGRARRRVITTDLVLAEAGNSLARTPLRDDLVWFVRQLHEDPLAAVVYADRASFAEAVDLYANRGDKSWGLIDCSSFVVMRAMGIVDSLTADHHFEQAGFNCLLPPIRRL
jgi:predicted nucleic acid-binding protein